MPHRNRRLLTKAGNVLAKYADKLVYESLKAENVFIKVEMEKTFVKYAKEYPKLGNRFWKKKRDYADFMARNIYRFMDKIEEKIDEQPKTVTFKRYGELTK